MAECKSSGLDFSSPDFKFYMERLKTYDSWSSQIKPDKFQLTLTGFFYSGRSDIVECFSCGLRLHKWEKEDDPLIEHRELSPNCLFMKMIGQTNTETNQNVDSHSKYNRSWSSWSSWDTVDHSNYNSWSPWSSSDIFDQSKFSLAEELKNI